MLADTNRLNRMEQALNAAKLDALICALSAYVVMTTGYWPVIGARL
ncbi:MAG: hypothetical protein ACE14M_09105 [Terriglobales bacterium]